MNIDDQAFARSLAQLRPAKTEIDPAVLLYQAGFAAGEAGVKSRERLLLRTAALALLAVGLAAGGGFYAGHQRGERAGYLAAIGPSELEPVTPLAPAPQSDVQTEIPETVAHETDSLPEPPSPSMAPRLAATESLMWRRLLETFAPQTTLMFGGAVPADSPLAIRTTAGEWEDLSDFRNPPERTPPRGVAQTSYPELPDLIEPPRRISHTNRWLQAITSAWGPSGP